MKLMGLNVTTLHDFSVMFLLSLVTGCKCHVCCSYVLLVIIKHAAKALSVVLFIL